MAAVKASVFGAGGFVGGHLVAHLRGRGFEVRAVGRGDDSWRGQPLGHVFFAIGLTADFRQRPLDTMDAHVGSATEVLRAGHFESFLYLSSTRLYAGASHGGETARITLDPSDPNDLYALSKLAGEAACLALPRREIRVARLSNLFGAGMGATNFLGSILRDARIRGVVRLGQSPDSAKDYLHIEDAVRALTAIALSGSERLFNVASGRETTHGEILAGAQQLTGCATSVEPGAVTVRYPPIAVERLGRLIPWAPVAISDQLVALLADFDKKSQSSGKAS